MATLVLLLQPSSLPVCACRWTCQVHLHTACVLHVFGDVSHNEQFFLVDALVCVLANARRASAGKNFFAVYWKSAFCPAAGTVGSFPPARFFCQHRCSGREAVSISPKQSVVGSTPTGLNPQTSNSFWLMFSRASCQTCEEHRLERFFLFIDSFSNFQAPIVQFHAAFAEKMCYNTNASRKSYSLFGKKRRATFTISNSCPTK